jgi:hypothetical protein
MLQSAPVKCQRWPLQIALPLQHAFAIGQVMPSTSQEASSCGSAGHPIVVPVLALAEAELDSELDEVDTEDDDTTVLVAGFADPPAPPEPPALLP